MKILIDMNLSPEWIECLEKDGHEAFQGLGNKKFGQNCAVFRFVRAIRQARWQIYLFPSPSIGKMSVVPMRKILK